VAQAGFPELTFSAVTGFFGWRDMPIAIKDKISADIQDVAADPAIKQRLEKIGVTARGSTPAEFVASIEQLRAKIAAIPHPSTR
jgi:tripartite-type tricarboxylate transporter receptor subunit TctC